jgi:hypothetical protein
MKLGRGVVAYSYTRCAYNAHLRPSNLPHTLQHLPQTLPMLKPKLLRTLLVDPASHPRGQGHLSAASGLVQMHGRCYVVADDEHHLGKFKLDSDNPVKLKRLFPNDLPLDPKKRKAFKPDLETLFALPAMPSYPQGALLALGSGSKEQRYTGLLMAFDAQCKLGKGDDLVTRRLDLALLYAPLHHEFADLNIEGCFISGDSLYLVQRGNKGSPRSACIALHLPQVQAWLIDNENPPPLPSRIVDIDLGHIDGVPLTPTDACALPDGRWLMTAAAENTMDSVLDGPCAGSAIAILSPQGELTQLHHLHGAPKVEGVSAQVDGKTLSLLMVTDADQPGVASQLLGLSLSV